MRICPSGSIVTAIGVFKTVDFYDSDLVSCLNSKHWLMESNPRDELVSVLSTYTPDTGYYWIRQAKMVITRH